MQDDKIRQAIEESLKPQRDVNKIIVAIVVTIIPIILTVAGTLAYNIALLLVISILVIYSGWAYSSRNKSLIDWNRFYDMLVRMKVLEEYSYDQKINVSHEVYNNYITFLYLAALYEGKEKFAKELWDKARIADKSDEGEQTKS